MLVAQGPPCSRWFLLALLPALPPGHRSLCHRRQQLKTCLDSHWGCQAQLCPHKPPLPALPQVNFR